MKTDIHILTSADIEEMKELISVFQQVFEMDSFKYPTDTYLQKLLNKNNFFAVVASADNMVIAGLTVYVLDQYYSEKPQAYIYDLAVLQEHQRKGIGKNLIDFTIDYCGQKGFEEVFVQAEKGDDYAIEFYRSTKPTEEEEAVHFSYLIKSKKY